MDNKFTEQIKEWLEKSEAERDYAVGALYLLKLSGNQIMYKNIIRCMDSRKQFVEYQLQKYYNFRVQALTHAQVEEMAVQVETIAEEHALTSDTAVIDGVASQSEEHDKRTGKRADHDSLPDDIKAKFVENLSILQRMRELHLRLRTLSLEDSTCPDSERYPFLKELITLDKKLHSNWEAYDHYVAEPAPKATPSRKRSAAGTAKKSAK
ncbi:MAG: hypothetical protein NC453_28795 [Muribaculum sp.]|nr:hypothetical protein [Muribaculum sp.]